MGSGEDYEVVDSGLVDGALAYIDRSYTFTDIPAYLEAATYIKTANDDKVSVGDDFLSLDVNQDVTVYVAHDDLITDKPSWLLDFTDTGDQLVTTDKSLSIYAKNFPAGTVTLGGNEGLGHSMYMVALVVVPGSPGPPLKPTNPSPLNGATGISVDSATSWSNGGGATSYDVYFGTNPSPGSGEFKGNQTSLAFDPGVLNYSATYYWRIDAINPEGTTTGDIWHFTTRSGEDLIVSNLTVGSGEDYEVVDSGLVDGALAYIDRSYTFTDIPAYLEGCDLYQDSQ